MKIKTIIAVTLAFCMLALTSCGLSQNNPAETSVPTDTEPAESTAPVNPEPEDVTVSFAAVGDNLIHESIYLEAAAKATALASSEGYTGSYSFDHMYCDDVRAIIKNADVAFVNQETPIVPGFAASGYPAFNTPEEAGNCLVSMGFDVVNIATNHMLDMEGRCEGLRSAIKFWNSRAVLPIGGYEGRDDYETVRVLQVKGKTVAFVSFTYGTNGNSLNRSSSDLIIPYIDDSEIIARVSAARKAADAVVVSMHWGEENSATVTSEQKRLASLLSKYGADVVIGHHSHTLQPVEWVTGESGRKTLVLYSLGNFISTQLDYENLVGGLCTFDLHFDKNGGVTAENVVMNPTVTHYSADDGELDSQGLYKRYGVSVRLLENYDSDTCAACGSQICGSRYTLADLRKIATDAVSAEFLPNYLK